MSGGCFGYAYLQWEEPTHWGIEPSLEAIKAEAPDSKAAKLAQSYFDDLQKLKDNLERLQHVMRAIEYWQSGDWGEEEFRKAVQDLETANEAEGSKDGK